MSAGSPAEQRARAAIRATIGYGANFSNQTGPMAITPATSAGQSVEVELDLGDTMAADEAQSAVVAAATTQLPGRTTVLPRRSKVTEGAAEARAVHEDRPRFARLRLLGQGGMGEVELARDNDIRRTVAVKRLHGQAQTAAALLRFADEVRIVGQLEHPSIVPVYDVGRDESGNVYLVMKHLQGETMESIIEKLRAGDEPTVARFTPLQRVHLFLGVLDAMRYAHSRGIIHRDLKPANIMIGPYGEVTVMDWGIAKPIRGGGAKEVVALARTLNESQDHRMVDTQFGSLAGTPLYMSPEQAAGRNDELDERSDVFSLCMLFFEWMCLEHPLQDKQTLTEVLGALVTRDLDFKAMNGKWMAAKLPVEYFQLLVRGLTHDRETRLASVALLERGMKRNLDGQCDATCPVSLSKRAIGNFTHWIDRNPNAFVLSLFAVVGVTGLSLLGGLGWAVWRLVH